MFGFETFNIFNYGITFVLSKFLKQYVKGVDENTIKLGLKEGSLSLNDIELNKDFFHELKIDLDIIQSKIEYFKLKLPLNILKNSTEPARLEIKGIKLIVSNGLMSDHNKKEFDKKRGEQNRQQLAEFEASLNKKHDQQSGYFKGVLLNRVKRFAENFVIDIQNIELVYVYHITDYEIIKMGFGLDKIRIEGDDTNPQNNSQCETFQKKIEIINISAYIEFYDNYFKASTTQKKTENGQINTSKCNHKTAAQNFYTKEPEDYILRNLDLHIHFKLDIKKDYITQIQAEISNNLLIYLQQHQIRLLLKTINNITSYSYERPSTRPGQVNGSKLWWKYTITKVLKIEKISEKLKNNFFGYVKTEEYQRLYCK